MLVTCPECGASISEDANPCLKCGYPEAGRFSKESAERRVQELQREFKELGEHTVSISCRKCGSKSWVEANLVKVELVNPGTRYFCQSLAKCPKCGGLAENYDH